ncbi:peroxisomal membrane protein PEX16-like isoform X3 [Aphis gossypii]|uniref:peroxisomal membrane protein PEX16-like isoform X1 n=1 Tax=Aphis gossypii TaxID=80765 RepID=UPI00100EF185|nr:peroxisomal membrane protein PEX16-like isoform X1 [Aphis gossypii]XP_050058708.1 peroxisomal membrane protein PEX16-like isoform X2 [Aphis gossypii]XP_050058709.1 peroxisomal membrane protein PEX16-like isoform X3 [Aphis gossypii]
MENLSKPTLRILYEHCVNWVGTHLERITEIEASIKCISYFLAGRSNNSTLLSELIYSISNFMMLFNDQIILSATKSSNLLTVSDKGKKKIFSNENIKCFITIVDFIEVFEFAIKPCGNKKAWIIILLLQTAKCVAGLYLLHVQKLILESPPTKLFDLKSYRLNGIPVSTLSYEHIVAETMYIIEPIILLGSMFVFGEKSFIPSSISLTIKYISLQSLKALENLTPQQRLVLSNRSSCWVTLFYQNIILLSIKIVRNFFFCKVNT